MSLRKQKQSTREKRRHPKGQRPPRGPRAFHSMIDFVEVLTRPPTELVTPAPYKVELPPLPSVHVVNGSAIDVSFEVVG